MKEAYSLLVAIVLGLGVGGAPVGVQLKETADNKPKAQRPAPVWAKDGFYEIGKEEPRTKYTYRENWAHPRPHYYTTTRHPDKDGGRMDLAKPPTGTYVGTATATFEDLPPGRYIVEVFYRRTENRSSKVPWNVESDGEKGGKASRTVGIVNQFIDAKAPKEAIKWWPLEETVAAPLEVTGKLVLVWGSDTDNGGRSISYGGARVRKVE